MTCVNRPSARLRRALLASAFVLGAGLPVAGAAHADELRPAVGKPLAAAKSELSRRNYAKALSDVNEADKVSGK